VGDASQLGAWNPAGAIQLQPTSYPTWTGTVFVPRNSTINYKFIKKDSAGNATWEGGGNNTFAVPDAATSSTGGSWQ
jgi:alpha-amylase